MGGMHDADRKIWDAMLAHLRKHQAPLCRQWFEELTPLGIGGGALNLRTTSAVHRDYLKRSCAEPFNDAARTVSGRLLSVRFLGPEDEPVLSPSEGSKPRPKATPLNSTTGEPATATMGHGFVVAGAATPAAQPITAIAGHNESMTGVGTPAMSAAAPSMNGTMSASLNGSVATAAPVVPVTPVAVDSPHVASMIETRPRTVQRADSLVINPDYGFENFVMGPGNRLAHAAAVAVSSNPGKAYNPLFIHGGVGLGKTHLLQAVCLKILSGNPGAVLYYLSCEAFVTQFMDSVQGGTMSDFRHRFRDVDVLVVDDIHFLAKLDRTQEEFFHTFNSLYQASKQIVLSSDAPPEDIPQLEDRLVSRFKWGLVCKLDAPCYETRVAILKTKAKLRSLVLPDDCAAYIAERIATNIRELEGAIVKCQIQSSVEDRPITLDLVRSALGEPAPQQAIELNIQTIITTVTEHYRVKPAELLSKRRQRSVALPRQVCMFLARKHTRMSLEEIGLNFGGRDHTTVMHAIKIIESRNEGDGDFSAVLRTLEDRLKVTRV